MLVLVESIPIDWKGTEWKGGLSGGEKNGDEVWNEGVWGGVDDKFSLVDDWASNFFVFLWWEGKGNSNGVTPSFSLWEWVKIQVDWKDEETLLSDNSNCCGFPFEIEIPSNFWIKVWTSDISYERGWSDDLGSVLGDFMVVFATFGLGVGDLEWDMEVGGELEGEWLFRWLFDLGSNLFVIHSQRFEPKNFEG